VASSLLQKYDWLQMDFYEVLNSRRSIRSYEAAPVPQDKLKSILEAARVAPSAGNAQPWHFIVVSDQKVREKIAMGCPWGRFIAEAPVLIVGCGDLKASRFYLQDTAVALEHLVLAATAMGLGTCWIGAFDEPEIRSLLEIPDHLKIVSLISIGAPKTRSLSKSLRKSIGEIVSCEQYGTPLKF